MHKTQTRNVTIGNYIISKILGEGTFGKVKLGIHMITGEKVAIKILEKNKIVDSADIERVTREINILKQVRHPNLIQLYEIIETSKQLFLVMEYVSEGELFQYIVRKKKIKQKQACQFFQQIIAGVQHLHSLHIVHRDLKPENLLIDYNKRIKLVDFGLSNTYKDKNNLKTACGSPCYAAPEMIAGKKYQGLSADLWSCGIILYAMVCGYLPFEDPNTPNLYKKIISGDFNIPKFVSQECTELLKGILTTDPEKRWKLNDIKNHSWFQQVSIDNNVLHNGIKVGQNNIPIDQNVLLSAAEHISSSLNECRKYIIHNRHNHYIAIYYLLLKRNLRNGLFSKYDICSPTFDINQLIKTKDKQTVQLTKNTEDVDDIELDNTNFSSGVQTSRNLTSRASNMRKMYETNNFIEHIARKKNQSIEFKFQLNKFDKSIDRNNKTGHNNHRPNYNIQLPKKNYKNIDATLYDIEEINGSKEVRKGSINYKNPILWRNSMHRCRNPQNKLNVSIMPDYNGNTSAFNHQNINSSHRNRYVSLQIPEQPRCSITKQTTNMNKTFMGKIPCAYTPKWQNQSQRIRGILNTTISGHGKRKHHQQQPTIGLY